MVIPADDAEGILLNDSKRKTAKRRTLDEIRPENNPVFDYRARAEGSQLISNSWIDRFVLMKIINYYILSCVYEKTPSR